MENWIHIRIAKRMGCLCLDKRRAGFIYISRVDGSYWIQPLKVGPPKKLTSLVGEAPSWFDRSRDGKELICLRVHTTVDLVLVANIK